MIVAQRLRKGSAARPRAPSALVADALKTTLDACRPTGRAGAGAGGLGVLRPRRGRAAALRRAEVSVTVRMDPAVKAAIATIADDGVDHDRVHRRRLRRDHQHLDLPGRGRRDRFTAFTSARKAEQVPAGSWSAGSRTSTRQASDGQDTLFDTWRFHAFFTTTDPHGPGHRGRGQDPPQARHHS